MQIIQRLRDKDNNHQIIVYIIVFTIASWILIASELWALRHSKLRMFAVFMCIASLSVFFYSLNDIYKNLVRAHGSDSIKGMISKEKLFAECASAISLIGLFAGIITFCADNDKKNTQGNFNAYIQIHKLVTFVGSNQNCNSMNESYNKEACKKIAPQSNEILYDISIEKNEHELKEKVQELKQNLKAANTAFPPELQIRVASILNQLDEFEISDIWYDLIKCIALFFAILYAPMALSRKIAIAWYEYTIAGLPRHPPSSIDK